MPVTLRESNFGCMYIVCHDEFLLKVYGEVFMTEFSNLKQLPLIPEVDVNFLILNGTCALKSAVLAIFDIL